jgi:ankyrin repeat protein
MRGHVEVIKLLLDKKANIQAKSNTGLTAIHSASINGHSRSVQLIIDKGGDPNAEDFRGSCPLHTAAIGGAPEVIEVLLNYCDSRMHADWNGWTPSLIASRSARSDISKRLQLDRDDSTCQSQIGTRSPTCWSQEDKGATLWLSDGKRTVEFPGI